MTYTELIARTRMYARDMNSFMFPETTILAYLNEAIDRISQYNVFNNVAHITASPPDAISLQPVVDGDPVTIIPARYHYILALYAASRCMEQDQRFYESTELRNEFESVLANLIAEIQCGNVVIKDSNGDVAEDTYVATDTVRDVYFYDESGEDGYDYTRDSSVIEMLRDIDHNLSGLDEALESLL